MDSGDPAVSDRAQVCRSDGESFPSERREIRGSSFELGPRGQGAQTATSGRVRGSLRVATVAPWGTLKCRVEWCTNFQ